MLVCWLRGDSLGSYLAMCHAEDWISGEEELAKTKHRYPHLCYGAYDGDKLIGGVTGYLHEKTAWVGNLIVDEKYRAQGVGRQLFRTVIKALKAERETIYLHAALSATGFYEKFGFEQIKPVNRYLYSANDENQKEKSFLKDYQNDNDTSTMLRFDKRFFGEDRTEFLLEDMSSKSSLLLACPNGFCHSKAIGKDIMLGAWEMVEGAYLDAERMLRTTISIRGQKNIYADVPQTNADMVAMYESYGFVLQNSSIIMVLGEPLGVKYENIFAFGSLGSKG
jgi:ribosomal protein S18 acetylase RimI-like enzyme